MIESRAASIESQGTLIFKKIKIFLEMIKFEHSLFALPFAYLGMILAAKGWPGWEKFFWITCAMVSFRTMAMAANRLVDAPIDALNPRTSSRALPVGLLNQTFVWVASFVSLILFSVACWNLNTLCLQLAIIPVLLAWIYPFLKRFSLVCHFLLGLILAIAPYGSWLAVRPEFSWIPGFFMLGVLFWVAGFDIIYALLDLDFDRSHGLHSIPAKLGEPRSKFLARALHILTLFFWAGAGISAQLSWPFFTGLLIAACLMLREHFLVRCDTDSKKINEAFFHLNAWIGIIIFIATWIDVVKGKS